MSPTWNMSKPTVILALVVCLACCVSCLSLEGLDKPEGYLSVQTRSSGPGRSTRFYQGTRYGGKRSYWHPFLSAESETGNGGNESSERSLSRRDCLYLSLIGVRCERSNDPGSHQQAVVANPAEARIQGGINRNNAAESSGRVWAQQEAVLE